MSRPRAAYSLGKRCSISRKEKPSHSPRLISRKAGNVWIDLTWAPAIILDVRRARDRLLEYTWENRTGSSHLRSAHACSTPSSFNGMSIWPMYDLPAT